MSATSPMEQKTRRHPQDQAPRVTTHSWTRDRPLPEKDDDDDGICIAPIAWLT